MRSILSGLLGWRYVILIDYDGTATVRRAYRDGIRWRARRQPGDGSPVCLYGDDTVGNTLYVCRWWPYLGWPRDEFPAGWREWLEKPPCAAATAGVE